jgi:ferrous iron transport protein B
MVTITLFVPCFASILVIFKERGAKYMVGLLFSSTGLAFLLGGLLTRLLEVF